MPPGLGSADEVAALVVAVITALGAIGAALLTAAAGVFVVWRTKLKPALEGLQRSTSATEAQVTPNHGSSLHDALGRVETDMSEVRRDVRYLRGDQRAMQTANDRVHEDLAGRLRRVEIVLTPLSAPTAASPIEENTRP